MRYIKKWLEVHEEVTALANERSIQRSDIIILDWKTQTSYWVQRFGLKIVNNSQEEYKS